MRSTGGFTLVEALVALALAGLAFAALAAAAALATGALRVATAQQAVLALTGDGLERLRLSGPDAGSDVTPGSPPLGRTWERTDGRGHPAHLLVTAEGDGRRASLETTVWP